MRLRQGNEVETGQCPVSTNETTQYKHPDVEVKMKPTGVADLNAGVRMKPIEQKMKPIRVGNPDVEVKLKPTGVADLNAFVKMKPIEQKMKPTKVVTPDVGG